MAQKAKKRSPVKKAKRAAPAQRARGKASAAQDFVSLQEIVLAARRKLPQHLWDHLSGGADSETTLLRNRFALDSLALRQRVA